MQIPEAYVAQFREIVFKFKPGMVPDEDFLIYLSLIGFGAYLDLGQLQFQLTKRDLEFLAGMRLRLAERAMGEDLVTMDEIIDAIDNPGE